MTKDKRTKLNGSHRYELASIIFKRKTLSMPKVGLLIFPFWTPHFVVWTPHFGWTPRLNFTVAASPPKSNRFLLVTHRTTPKNLKSKFVDFHASALTVWGIMHRWPLSVCLSVACLTISREWKGVASWKLAGRKPGDTGYRDSIYRSRGQSSRSPGRLTPWTKIIHTFGSEGLRTSNLVYRWVWWPASPTCAVTSKLKALWVAVQVTTYRGGGGILRWPHYRPHSLFWLLIDL